MPVAGAAWAPEAGVATAARSRRFSLATVGSCAHGPNRVVRGRNLWRRRNRRLVDLGDQLRRRHGRRLRRRRGRPRRLRCRSGGHGGNRKRLCRRHDRRRRRRSGRPWLDCWSGGHGNDYRQFRARCSGAPFPAHRLFRRGLRRRRSVVAGIVGVRLRRRGLRGPGVSAGVLSPGFGLGDFARLRPGLPHRNSTRPCSSMTLLMATRRSGGRFAAAHAGPLSMSSLSPDASRPDSSELRSAQAVLSRRVAQVSPPPAARSASVRAYRNRVVPRATEVFELL